MRIAGGYRVDWCGGREGLDRERRERQRQHERKRKTRKGCWEHKAIAVGRG
jgi:hypothetical protein